MRKMLILSLIALLGFNAFAHAQSSGFPPCSESELSFVLELQSEYDALVDSLTTGLDSSLAYAAAQIQWREGLWSSLPPCAEAIDVAVLMSHISSDLGALTAVNYSGVSLSLNRYKDRLNFEGNMHQLLDSVLAEIATLIENAERPAAPAPGERALTACSDDEVGSLTTALLYNQDLIVSAFDIQTRGQLLDYINAKLTWRDEAWDQLPPCAESVEIGRLMSQTASDVATAIAYSYAGVAPTDNPYAAVLEDELNQLGGWLEYLLGKSSSASGKTLSDTASSDLPPCSDQALAVLDDSLAGAADLVEATVSLESTSALLRFGSELIAWRDQLFSRLPYCAEAVETALLVANFLADIVSARALTYADIPADDNPFHEETLAKIPLVHEALDRSTGGADRSESLPDSVEVLAACTDAERETLILQGTELQLYEDQAADIETADDLLSFARVHLFMRETWRWLPPCQEAIKAGLLLIQLTADTLPAAAFHFFAGVPSDANIYWEQSQRTRESLYELLAAYFDDGNASEDEG